MLVILYGVNAVDAREAVAEFIPRETQLQVLEDEPPQSQAATLFGEAPVYLVKNGLEKFIENKSLATWWAEADARIIFLEDKLNASIQKQLPKEAIVKEFTAPKDLVKWFLERMRIRGGRVDLQTARKILLRLGIDARRNLSSETFWRLDSEAAKMASFSLSGNMSDENIAKLVSMGEGAVFAVVDALISGNLKQAFNECDKIFASEKDETAASLQLLGACAETLRSIRLWKTWSDERRDVGTLASQANWPAWKERKVRLSAANITLRQVNQCLEKLTALDGEIKRSGLPPRVVFELILASFVDK